MYGLLYVISPAIAWFLCGPCLLNNAFAAINKVNFLAVFFGVQHLLQNAFYIDAPALRFDGQFKGAAGHHHAKKSLARIYAPKFIIV